MHFATIDIGTNTVLYLKCEATSSEPSSLVAREQGVAIVRLGEGLDRSGRLSEAAMERALAALRDFGARAAGVERATAVATEAVRKAENGDVFLTRASEALGFPVACIDGAREAQLSWLATARSLPARTKVRTVLDIGGGSTELARGGDEPEQVVSVPIGSVRLTERLLHHDVPTDEEQRALVEAIDSALEAAPRPEGELVGIAGTVTTLCAIGLGLADYDAEQVHGRRMSRDEVERIVTRLGAMSGEERRRLPGLDPRRADVIYSGGMILCRVLARSSLDGVTVSDRGVRWGLAYELLDESA